MGLVNDSDRKDAVTLYKSGLDGNSYALNLSELLMGESKAGYLPEPHLSPGGPPVSAANGGFHFSSIADDSRQRSREPKMESPMHQIMVVDDEDMILMLIQSILERMGYAAEIYTNPLEAVDAFSRDPASYQLLITDQRMPEMLGTELVDRIHSMSASTPVIMCSGYSKEVEPENAQDFGIDEYLSKPVSYDLLATTVERLLAGGNHSV